MVDATVSSYRHVDSTVRDKLEDLVDVRDDAKIDMLSSPKINIEFSVYA
jgi:hypothetical protein